MSTTVHVPIRWSDMDSYGHVNNATLMRLVEHAEALVEPADAVGATEPYELVVQYFRPIVHVDGAVEISRTCDGETWETMVSLHSEPCARVRRGIVTPGTGGAAPVPAQSIVARPSDFGADGTLTWAGMLDLVQESRIALIAGLIDSGRIGDMAVVEVRAAVTGRAMWTREPSAASAWVDRVGESSLHVMVTNDLGIRAATVLVAIDESGRRSWSAGERTELQFLTLHPNGVVQ